MRTLTFVLWLLIAWPLPALLAGALGWSSVWGGGSAFVDYIIPAPISGGVLHVPSFVLCSFIVRNMSSASTLAADRMRALLLGFALAGVLLLLRLDALWLAFKTDSTLPGGVWQSDPLGLFLLSDAVVAGLLTLGIARDHRLRFDAVSLLLLVLPASVPVGMALKYSPAEHDFLPGDYRQGANRADEINLVFTNLDVNAPDFRRRAQDWVGHRHPRFSVNSDDAAFLFTRDFDAARRFDTSKGLLTLCLYEDDTPAVWLPGAATQGCFENHISFTELFQRAYAARPATEPPDVKDYMARKDICVGIKTTVPSGDTSGLELSGTRICSGLQRMKSQLREKYPDLRD